MAVARIDFLGAAPGTTSAARCALAVRRIVLAALVVGVAVGALACSASLATGGGHAGHAAATDIRQLTPTNPHVDHQLADHQPADHQLTDHQPADHGMSDDGNPSAGDATAHSHTGSACVVPVDLRFPEPPVTTGSDTFSVPAPAMLSDRCADVEPPVPKIT